MLPSDGVASVAPARSAGASMPSRTTSDAPPEVVPETMRNASPPELGVPVDRRVGPDERGVEGVGEHRLDDLGPGVERVELQLDPVAERRLEDAGLDAEDRRGVGDVWEVPEPERDRCRGRVAVGAARCRGQGHGNDGDGASDLEKSDQHCRDFYPVDSLPPQPRP